MTSAAAVVFAQASSSDCPKYAATTATSLPPRSLITLQVPPGTLQMNISPPHRDSYGHVWVMSIQSSSPVLGRIHVGDWIVNVNGVPVISQDGCVELFRSTAAIPRTVQVSRAAAGTGLPPAILSRIKDEENHRSSLTPSSAKAPSSLVTPPASSSSSSSSSSDSATSQSPATSIPDNTALLIEMSAVQLKKELKRKGLSQTAGTKDALLERLGVPATQWRAWRNMTIAHLKDELKRRGHKVKRGTNKTELLKRLGVPLGFGESVEEKRKRMDLDERKNKKRKLQHLSQQLELPVLDQEQELKQKIKMDAPSSSVAATTTTTENAQYDPITYEDYYFTPLPPYSCESPSLVGYGHHQSEPAAAAAVGGHVDFPEDDESIMDAWQCSLESNGRSVPQTPPHVLQPIMECCFDHEPQKDEHDGGDVMWNDDYNDFFDFCNQLGLSQDVW